MFIKKACTSRALFSRVRASSSACPAARPKSNAARSANRRSGRAPASVYLIEEPMAAAIGADLPVGRSDRLDGCGYRRRHHRSRRDFPGRDSCTSRFGARRRRQIRRCHHQLHSPQLRHADWRNHRRKYKEGNRLRVSRQSEVREMEVKGRNLAEGIPSAASPFPATKFWKRLPIL